MRAIIQILKTKWRFDDEKRRDLKRYAEFVSERFSWEVRQGTIPSLLTTVEKLSKDLEYSENAVHHMRSVQDMIQDDYKQTTDRFEKEVIHLKELVQEKNMIIDKMLSKKK